MKCPNCQSTRIRKHGFYRQKQRYQCKDCARQFVENHSPNLHQQTSTGVEDSIDRYLTAISTPASDLLLNIQAATLDYPLAKMQPTLAQAQLIAVLIRSMGASRVLELGIFSGHCTLALALALPPQGQLISAGVSGAHLDIARDYWERGGVSAKINFQIGSGLELLAQLHSTQSVTSFDLITIAGLKHQYPLYYHQAIDLLRPQGLLVTTDVLWQGRVLNPQTYDDDFTRGLELFNRELVADPRLNVSALSIGDGMSIAVKL
jgi:predicted O-methyltransferase YrrM